MENFSGRDDEAVSEFKAAGSERVKPLHNFTLSSLKWGKQRLLRCVKADSSSSDDELRLRRKASPPAEPGASPSRTMNSDHRPPRIQNRSSWDRPAASGSSAAQVRNNVMPLDLDQVKKSSSKEEEIEGEIERMEKTRRRRGETATERPPWNLRARKGAPGSRNGGGGGSNEHQIPSGSKGEDKAERTKFSVALTKKEIDEDFMAMAGHLPPRRPKKRPGNLQRQLDSVFPGSWLKEVTPDSYIVWDSTERKTKTKQTNE